MEANPPAREVNSLIAFFFVSFTPPPCGQNDEWKIICNSLIRKKKKKKKRKKKIEEENTMEG